MTEYQMNQIDKKIEPLLNVASTLLTTISKKIPCPGYTLYKRSPLRSLKATIRHLEKINRLLSNIE